MIEAIHRLFNNVAVRKTFLKLRYVLVLALVGIIALYMKPRWLPVAFAVSLIGALIQSWAFAALIKNKELAVRGPYVLTRNPMYLGRFILVLGLLLLPADPYLIVVYCALYYFYMVNRVKREEQHLRQVRAEPYEEYCRRVNRFWPTLSRLTDKHVYFFEWKRFKDNNGHWNFLSVLAIYGVLYAYALYITPG
jgi:protein-S-isoprenylcysteine O-methyltransferase Ste14